MVFNGFGFCQHYKKYLNFVVWNRLLMTYCSLLESEANFCLFVFSSLLYVNTSVCVCVCVRVCMCVCV